MAVSSPARALAIARARVGTTSFVRGPYHFTTVSSDQSALRPVWQEFLDNLAPLATSDDADALKPENYQGAKVFVRIARAGSTREIW